MMERAFSKARSLSLNKEVTFSALTSHDIISCRVTRLNLSSKCFLRNTGCVGGWASRYSRYQHRTLYPRQAGLDPGGVGHMTENSIKCEDHNICVEEAAISKMDELAQIVLLSMELACREVTIRTCVLQVYRQR